MARKSDTKLTQQQVEELGRALREKREQLRAREPDPMDIATEATAGAEGDALSAHDTYLLAEIESAFIRLRDGRYGVSEESGDPIAYARLRLIPWARRTAEEEEERANAAPPTR